MAVPRLTDDLDIIQKLSDNPNDTDGLSAAELKARFDAAVNIIKVFLNSELAAVLDAVQANADKLDGKEISSVLGIDNSTIPTSAAVRASMSSAGMGDMAAATYDVQGKRQDIFMYADGVVGGHSADPEAHNDIRVTLQDAVDRINAVLDSDDETLDELSEIVAYIKSNSDLLEAVTLAKVSVADVVDNLTTNVATKPLSAAQGVALKALVDGITAAAIGALPSSGGTVTGNVTVSKTDPYVYFENPDLGKVGLHYYSSGGKGALGIYSTGLASHFVVFSEADKSTRIQGPLILVRGVHYGTESERPAGTDGQLYLKIE